MTLFTVREHFAGPTKTSDVWTLQKDGHAATCTLWTHQLGHELRLAIDGDDLPRTQVVRTQDDLITVQETWRAALEAKGWGAAAAIGQKKHP